LGKSAIETGKNVLLRAGGVFVPLLRFSLSCWETKQQEELRTITPIE
jgi:hypothetical protein